MAIDGGTTNTRVRILQDDRILSQVSSPVGVRNTAITGSKKDLVEGIRQAIIAALRSARIEEKDLHLVAASGMITSNIGIYEIPHVSTPAGIDQLAAASRRVKIPELMELPILFIPGVKNDCAATLDTENLEAMDIMRGEETEAIGILELTSLKGPLTMVLPGSHTKIVTVNEHNQISGCLTTMGGEIYSTLATNTILADSIPSTLISELDVDMILKGAALSRKVGLTRGCFSVRIMSQFLTVAAEKRADFLLGVVLGQDLIAIKNSLACEVHWQGEIIIGGPAPLRHALYYLLAAEPDMQGRIILLDDKTVEMSTAVGAKVIGSRYLNMIAKQERGWEK